MFNRFASRLTLVAAATLAIAPVAWAQTNDKPTPPV